MAINFPATPTVGDTFVVGLKTFTWDGSRWSSDPRTITTGSSVQRPTVTKPYLYYNNTLRSYEIYLPEYNRWEQISTYAVVENPTSEYGEASYVVPGTYSWTCPAGVYYVNAVCVGGGAGSRSSNISNGTLVSAAGSGGGLGWKNLIPVVPGTSYSVQVGAGGVSIAASGAGSTNPGGNSFFINTDTVAGFGGGAGTNTTVGIGGIYTGDGGGFGGNAYPSTGASYGSSGGGGAGGYTGNGGNGGYYSTGGVNATAGAGGGGGGGGYYISGSYSYTSGGGGGVGILGQGTSGSAGSSAGGTAAAFRGAGGSGGQGGTQTAVGGDYGGGAGSAWNLSAIYNGGGGAVRLIWGPDRAFPSTNTGTI
jgi:hypothetical protein